ncbi:epoxide hydrolase [bacterium M00.F.Ca.ET.228.01.1.1]|uniref:epoxide hydrolase family protein n=1 Tax=Paraburkholderia phenoliruptrix TaxID=252970 RepID=UPI001092E53F|nr:epoxide hydrolase family protein [Paraburkholderia phenoliruptrix]TGP48058.1 epoxide hydrolase [bacterium M00.F.Ca.ET.228.01.1.1]TGS05850.1 epoxide hydrolase [bacterium M00.F.Ca.ET.191.01.1.1]TGU10787.1 epoxide hydrolase [bacterium M00.F.Ca.ET.155.01.1.1]MBW0445118.1 epoxide hydrolase [Paraburkholderia phenoliruptrix]MBW9095883.1 epoxide hydrolase [Paraburkholderia phenoliruptrix]
MTDASHPAMIKHRARGEAIMSLIPFRVNIPDEDLARIGERIKSFRWDHFLEPYEATEWRYGPPAAWMRTLCNYWLTDYQWRDAERNINTVEHCLAKIGDQEIHVIHERGSGACPRPLLLVHGWPYSFASYLHLIEPLAHPERFGGNRDDAFSVVIPSLPGFGFSPPPVAPVGPRRIASIFNQLMTDTLGYDEYLVHGGDWGSAVAEMLGLHHPANIRGIHLTMLSVRHHGAAPRTGSVGAAPGPTERSFAAREAELWKNESAYARIQATKPLKLAYSMFDSPVGVAAWIAEAFHAWSDLSQRPFSDAISMDRLLTEIMLYLVTDNFGPSTWIYVAEQLEGYQTLAQGQRIDVPVALAAYRDPVFPMPPREVASLSHSVVRYTTMPTGGHFPFYEDPDALTDDLRDFARQLG